MRVLAWPLKTGLNPYTDLVFSSLGPGVTVDGWPGNLLRKYDVWHAHWPDALLGIPNTPHAIFKLSGMFAAMDFLRSRGTNVIWTIHNLASHEARHPRLEAWFWRHFIPRVDGAISLSATGLDNALERFPGLRKVPTTVIPHGHYREQYPPAATDSRAALGIPRDVNVIMFFGAVRAYKNVDHLIRAFRQVHRKAVALYIVGNPNFSELAQRLATEASEDPRVVLKFKFIADQDVFAYLNAADLLVLPYREVLNSGSALLALSCNKPVLVPELGAMGELQREFSDRWVQTFSGSLNGPILESALDWAVNVPRPQVCPIPEKYNWNNIGQETVQFYERVVRGLSTSEAQPHLVTVDRGGTPQ
jgi:glycosyltransferase involved in cell wall biosynthesis